MAFVIGFDFGNCNSYPCFLSDGFDPGTRKGGIVHDLLPGGFPGGIPSVYYYSGKNGSLYGEDAVRPKAKPKENRLRYLKRHLGETINLDGEEISYDSAITGVIQHCIRRANEQLMAGWQTTTNRISLSYPASYTFAQRKRLVELAEKATLADGTLLEVEGTIAEPAAAALDYLAEFARTDQETPVLVLDLGGGTLDLALVSAYPAGRRRKGNASRYYYDVLNVRGLADVGGLEFDEAMYQILLSKTDVPLKEVHKESLRELAEEAKIDLSNHEDTEVTLFYNDSSLVLGVTRAELEQACEGLIRKMTGAVREMLQDNACQQPEWILLTGGASQMPMVMHAMETAFPQFSGRVAIYRPSRSIAYGAARFGAKEDDGDIHPGDAPSSVLQRTAYDIGVRFYKDAEDREGYIHTYIPAGTPIPCTGKYIRSMTFYRQRHSDFRVYEAAEISMKNSHEGGYTEIMSVTLDHGEEAQAGAVSETRMLINERGLLTIEARDISGSDTTPVTNQVQLKNLSAEWK